MSECPRDEAGGGLGQAKPLSVPRMTSKEIERMLWVSIYPVFLIWIVLAAVFVLLRGIHIDTAISALVLFVWTTYLADVKFRKRLLHKWFHVVHAEKPDR